MQQYLEVIVASQAYHGSSPLTYASDRKLPVGTIVTVPLRSQEVMGVVVAITARQPSFAIKPVASVPDLPLLASHMLALLEWIPTYYPSPLGIIAQHFFPRRIPSKELQPAPLTSAANTLPPLTNEQESALKRISGPGLHLLHGETGSGKTRVYIELARRSLESGKSAIILTPEISLTSQLANDFSNVFSKAVTVVHSQLTEATRRMLWLKLLREKTPQIVIGPRSALFMPLQTLGLIVVDEAHEPAYKQDQAPYYNAVRIASKLAELTASTIVLGTATPLITDYYVAQQKKRPVVRMTTTAAGSSAPGNVEIVDLRNTSLFTRKSHLSDPLLRAIGETLSKHEQVLLFLNRRGTARVVFCAHCDWQATCPHCDLPLIYHGDTHRIRCHTCNLSMPNPSSCPVCHSPEIVYKNVGTKAIVEEVNRFFPEAKVQRFDADNKRDERVEQHYDALRSGQVDVIIGTQTLAKGLDLPKLGLVGVILADTSLYIPDFNAQERTYQLMSQVIGRVGRGHRASRAIIQTYSPNSPALQAAITKDWDHFYNDELAERRRFTYPPFCYLLKLQCTRASAASAEKAAANFVQQIRRLGLRVTIDGPAPAFHEKTNRGFAWQLVVKAKERTTLLQIIAQLPSGWSYDIDPLSLA